ncbi:MAG: hypothetical protein E7163_04390 [Firmicutes bacterium]|nr:hypothetical protein [Bacillota bacterium]
MKKISLFLIICLLLVTGCGKKAKNVEGTLEELMTKVYASVSDEEKPMMLTNTEVNNENIEYYLGTADIEYKEALASESAVGSIAHSVVLLRTKDNADIEAIKTKIKESINPRKWVCVGVEEKDVIVENKGDLVVLILVENSATREKLEESFKNL